jgi:5-methyltetrahydrofolate--homocysteine methyltransferase
VSEQNVNTFLDRLASPGVLLADGAMGTSLFALGLESGDPPELWNLTHPEVVSTVHRGYVDAGADLMLTNSFGGNTFRLKLHNLQDRVIELNRAAAVLAKRVADEAEGHVWVAGSMGPTGELLEPMGTMTPAACATEFAEQAEGLVAGGVDVLWLETLSDLSEVVAAVEGIRSVTDCPITATMSFDTAGRTMMGVTATDMAVRLAELGLAGFGANCGNNLADTEAAVAEMVRAGTGVPLICKANAGIPEWKGDGLVYSGTPEVMASHAARLQNLGVKIIGGCCGSGHDHLAMMRRVLDGGLPSPEIEASGGTQPRSDTGVRRRRRSRS